MRKCILSSSLVIKNPKNSKYCQVELKKKAGRSDDLTLSYLLDKLL